jgi:hypothetical protein
MGPRGVRERERRKERAKEGGRKSGRQRVYMHVCV